MYGQGVRDGFLVHLYIFIVDLERCLLLCTVIDVTMSVHVGDGLSVTRVPQQLHGVRDYGLVCVDVFLASGYGHCITELAEAWNRIVIDDLVDARHLEAVVQKPSQQRLLFIAGDFNAHVGVVEPGEEESVGRYGWVARNREGRALAELVAINRLAMASSFFQNRESHKITYRSGQRKTELDLVIVRKQQLWKIKDCKAVAGEHVTTQHKPVVFVVRMQKKKQTKTVGRRTIKWWKCVAVEYKERMTVK